MRIIAFSPLPGRTEADWRYSVSFTQSPEIFPNICPDKGFALSDCIKELRSISALLS